MKVKVGNHLYDSNHEPIKIVLSDQDRTNIQNMGKGFSEYCSYPDTMDPEEALQWMREDD